MKNIFNLLFGFILVVSVQSLQAQKYFTKEGNVSFYSKAPLEDIEAHNAKATGVLDMGNGNMEWAILIKAFKFEKALMQEHFNENYMESSKFPKATFKGQLLDYIPIDLTEDASYTFQLEGTLNIHGISKPVKTTTALEIQNGVMTGESELTIKVADYKIGIPSIVRDKIAKEVKIVINAEFQPMDRSKVSK